MNVFFYYDRAANCAVEFGGGYIFRAKLPGFKYDDFNRAGNPCFFLPYKSHIYIFVHIFILPATRNTYLTTVHFGILQVI